jgi:hypothetical protein
MRRWLLVVSLLAAGCPSTPPPECKTVETTCSPAYVPTFTNVYNNTLKDSCGSNKSGCHSAASHKGGLSLATQDEAFAALTDPAYHRVVPGDPGCSEMIVRSDSPGEDYQMPPGDALSAPDRCALIQWVLQGANP